MLFDYFTPFLLLAFFVGVRGVSNSNNLSTLTAMIEALTGRLEIMEESRQMDKQIIESLRNDMKEVLIDNEMMKAKITRLEGYIAQNHGIESPGSDGSISDVRKDDVALETPNKINRINDDPKQPASNFTMKEHTRTVSPPKTVAFYAIRQVVERDLNFHQIIRFDQVVTNIGDGYKVSDGTFVCEQAGTYFFTWTVAVDYNHYIRSILVKNGETVGTSMTTNGHMENSISSSGIISLVPGDTVSVMVMARDPGATIVPIISAFSGFLIG